jgi:DedD protein
MRSLLDDIEEEEETTAREITLSTASLLGIFFGLVLICGVFFGFGYSLGRGTQQGAQAASLGTGPASSAPEADDTTSAANQQPVAPPSVQSQDDADAPAQAAQPVSVKHAKPDDAEDASGEDTTEAREPSAGCSRVGGGKAHSTNSATGYSSRAPGAKCGSGSR